MSSNKHKNSGCENRRVKKAHLCAESAKKDHPISIFFKPITECNPQTNPEDSNHSVGCNADNLVTNEMENGSINSIKTSPLLMGNYFKM